jgi:twitching motility protein PilT
MSSAQQQLVESLVEIVIKEGASDIHLSEDRPPVIRVDGYLIPLLKMAKITHADMEMLASLFLSPEKKREFAIKKEANFAYSYQNKARFRCNIYFTLGKISIAMRLIPVRIKSFEELNLPPILETFTKYKQGFFLVVGPAGQGKSTTLSTMIDSINKNRLDHIVTIEDPIEYVFTSDKAIIDQREVKIDTPDFHTALRGVFRQDADMVMIGEMRDPETIATAVTAAETGHLIFSTLHTNTAAQTIDRIIDSFPGGQQAQIRSQLASSLLGVFSQRLIPRISGGLIPACELLINNNAVGNLIRERRTHEIGTVIETGSESGMIDLNRYLAGLVREGEITVENAYLFSHNPTTLERML